MTPDHVRSVLHISMAKNPQKIVFLSFMTALAMVLQIVEHLLPNPFPWIRLGIANVILLIVLSIFGIREGLMVTGLRVVMASILLGTIFGPTFWLSLGGGIVSTLVMGMLMNCFPKAFSIIGISVVGAYVHNLTQLFIAFFIIFREPVLIKFLPILLLTSLIAGFLTGMVATMILERLQKMGI